MSLPDPEDTGNRVSRFQAFFARPVPFPACTREDWERMGRELALIKQADGEWREEQAILRQCGITEKE